MSVQFTVVDINMVLKVPKIPFVNILAEHYRLYSTVAIVQNLKIRRVILGGKKATRGE